MRILVNLSENNLNNRYPIARYLNENYPRFEINFRIENGVGFGVIVLTDCIKKSDELEKILYSKIEEIVNQ